MMLFIRDLSKSCGMEVYRVEKSNVRMEVALWTPKWPNLYVFLVNIPYILNNQMNGTTVLCTFHHRRSFYLFIG